MITLTPSSTELVCELAGCDKLVGVDEYSNFPDAVKTLPKVGDFLTPNLEKIAALAPDLVVLDLAQSKSEGKLHELAIRTIAVKMHDISDLMQGIVSLGAAVGQPRKAEELVSQLKADIATAKARTKGRMGKPKRALIIIDRQAGSVRGLVAAGPGSYLDELLQIVGAQNVLDAHAVRYAKISAETVAKLSPDIILDTSLRSDSSARESDWSELVEAIPGKTVQIVPLVNDLFFAPGPRLGTALIQLEALVYN